MIKDEARNLYKNIIHEIDVIFNRINQENLSTKSKDVSQYSLEVLTKLRNGIKFKLEDLESNIEWERYTIAFYGETNAGKSTVIECLRLYFQESSKVIERKKFNELNNLSLLISNKNKLLIAHKNLVEIGLIKEAALIAEHLKIAEQEIENRDRLLSNYADGNIIGDGNSDFTKKSSHYYFESQLGGFTLIDVPGIEGNEQIVIDEILKSVKKAHAVFYVTGKAAPPQKGEGTKMGTVEKIKVHLDAQAEVYSIFNKRITNPMALKTDLVSVDEQVSIASLDKEMANQLGKNYSGSFCLSAGPAFFGSPGKFVGRRSFSSTRTTPGCRLDRGRACRA